MLEDGGKTCTPLMLATLKGYAEVVKRLLKVPNIDINKPNKYGDTALVYAVKYYRTNITERSDPVIAALLLHRPEIDITFRKPKREREYIVDKSLDELRQIFLENLSREGRDEERLEVLKKGAEWRYAHYRDDVARAEYLCSEQGAQHDFNNKTVSRVDGTVVATFPTFFAY